MTPDEIKEHAQRLIDELGLSPNVSGMADKAITGVSSGMEVLKESERMMNDLMVLVRELAEHVAQLEVERSTKLPQAGALP